MRQGSFKAFVFALGIILMAGTVVVSAFGDENTVAYEAYVLEGFDGNADHEWVVGAKTRQYSYTWALDASKFASAADDGENFPRLNYVTSWPLALFGANREGRDLKSLGVWGRFDRRGYNWIDVYPVSGDNGEPFEIPVPGRASYFDMWVWGSNLDYYIEIYVRDYQGVVHTINLGSIAFTGWKNLQVRVPSNIPQSKRIQPRLESLTFVKFRIWTTPLERVDNFYIYFDQFKVLTDTFESLFDGDELADPERVQELWASGN